LSRENRLGMDYFHIFERLVRLNIILLLLSVTMRVTLYFKYNIYTIEYTSRVIFSAEKLASRRPQVCQYQVDLAE